MGWLLPDHDWFVIIAVPVGVVLICLLPPRLPKSIMFLVMLMGLTVPLVLDHSIGVPPFDMYDTQVKSILTWDDAITWLLYPIFAYLFIYGCEFLKVGGLGIPLYIFLWTLFATGFEAVAVYFHVYEYKGWALRFSFVTYIVVQLLLVVFYNILKLKLAAISREGTSHERER